jgi:transposase InsO family protein
VEKICTLYGATPLLQTLGAHIVSTDELTSIQALERTAPTKPMRPGLVERREFEYKRHGTLSAIVSLDVGSGAVLEASLGPTRTEQDFTAHMARTLARDPDGVWVFVVDRLNIHQSASLVDLIAKHCGLSEEVATLRAQGGLKAMASRTAWLSNPSHRIQFVYTPTHTSWLNQIELWFSILVRRALKRGNFPSLEALRERIEAFITYYNQTAKPFRWTYTGRPLVI